MSETLTQLHEMRAKIDKMIRTLSVPLPVIPTESVGSELRDIPFISLMDADRKKWYNWSKCIDQPVSKVEDVQVGYTGSIGAAYSVKENLDQLFEGCPDLVSRERKLLSTPRYLSNGKLMRWQSAHPLAEFYGFSKQDEQPYFVPKNGMRGLWLCKKTSGYYHAPPAERATEPLVSEHQRTSGYYEHRFSFVVVRRLTDEEANLDKGFNMSLIKKKKIVVP